MLVSNKLSTEFDDRKVQWHRLSNLKENNVVFENCQSTCDVPTNLLQT
jgi:hypothetical protein